MVPQGDNFTFLGVSILNDNYDFNQTQILSNFQADFIPRSAYLKSGNFNDSDYEEEDLSPRDSLSSYKEFHAAMFIVKWILPFFVFIGILGNIAAIAVLVTPRMRKTSVNLFLICLACADTVVLVFSALKTWLRVISGFEMLYLSNGACKIIIYCFLMGLHLSGWLVVAISVDRFLVICFPLQAPRYSTLWKAKIQIALLILALAIYNIHVFWTISLHGEPNRYFCGPDRDNYYMNNIFPWVKLASYSCIPFVSVLILNSIMVGKILKSKIPSRNTRQDDNQPRISREMQITVMLFLVSFTWLLLTAPFNIWSFMWTSRPTTEKLAQEFLAKTLCFLLMYTNHGINFYLYCISGNKFRKELLKLIHLEYCRCRRKSPILRRSLSNTHSQNHVKIPMVGCNCIESQRTPDRDASYRHKMRTVTSNMD